MVTVRLKELSNFIAGVNDAMKLIAAWYHLFCIVKLKFVILSFVSIAANKLINKVESDSKFWI